ncbi:TolA protein [Pelomyxa schiedti]|nr:TolA protein [Pelomyxa schiedti]
MASKIPPALIEKWNFISGLPYAAQCKWVMNGFWDRLENEGEQIWTWCQTFSKLDQEKGAAGNQLDEFWSHKFLESLGETMTVIEMREKFRTIDADYNKKMSMIEYLIYKYKFPIPAVINAPQGENKEAINHAQSMVDSAQRAMEEMNQKLEQSSAAAAQAKSTADVASKAAEVALAAAQEDKRALDDLRSQEDSYKKQMADLEAIKGDMSVGVVRRNKAANELDQLKGKDPLPLSKAKITQQATLKKSEKARALAEEAKAKANADAEAAEAAEQAARASVQEAERQLQAANDELERAKKLGGVANGDIWWLQREIAEKKKYLPKGRASRT